MSQDRATSGYPAVFVNNSGQVPRHDYDQAKDKYFLRSLEPNNQDEFAPDDIMRSGPNPSDLSEAHKPTYSLSLAFHEELELQTPQIAARIISACSDNETLTGNKLKAMQQFIHSANTQTMVTELQLPKPIYLPPEAKSVKKLGRFRLKNDNLLDMRHLDQDRVMDSKTHAHQTHNPLDEMKDLCYKIVNPLVAIWKKTCDKSAVLESMLEHPNQPPKFWLEKFSGAKVFTRTEQEAGSKAADSHNPPSFRLSWTLRVPDVQGSPTTTKNFSTDIDATPCSAHIQHHLTKLKPVAERVNKLLSINDDHLIQSYINAHTLDQIANREITPEFFNRFFDEFDQTYHRVIKKKITSKLQNILQNNQLSQDAADLCQIMDETKDSEPLDLKRQLQEFARTSNSDSPLMPGMTKLLERCHDNSPQPDESKQPNRPSSPNSVAQLAQYFSDLMLKRSYRHHPIKVLKILRMDERLAEKVTEKLENRAKTNAASVTL